MKKVYIRYGYHSGNGIYLLLSDRLKISLFEHFTQASCGPCAAQNPYFQAVYGENVTNVHHVAYHTSWPGYDPMYEYSTAESEAMVQFYSVSGVP